MRQTTIIAIVVSTIFLCIIAFSAPSAAPSNPVLRPHPFGVMVSGSSADEKARRAILLGSRYIRPTSIFTGRWHGHDEECDAARAAGLQLILTVRNSSGPRQPSNPPTDLSDYKRIIGEILDKYHPALLVVENEENSVLFYNGTPKDYLRQLAAAVEVAHAKGIKVANGGLVSDLVAILVATSLEERGKAALADDYLQKTLGDRNWRKLRGSSKWCEQIEKGKSFLAGYKATGVDYINFHWYNDAVTFKEAVTYVGTITGLPVISNELGQQKSTNPEEVTSLMQMVSNLNIPIAIWFSIDVSSHGQARGLFDKNGSLRPNGEAFRKFIISTYSK